MNQLRPKAPTTKPGAPAHDHAVELKRINRIKGQVLGIERMIIEKRYCPEIVIQIKAIRSALRSLEANIIEGHVLHCVKDAIKSKDATVVQDKLDEIISLFKGQQS
jgi:DNA-binding FrmR family transcriptional regulator